MRVLQAMAGAPIGGAEMFFERLVHALHRKGVEQYVVIRPDTGRASRLRAAGIRFRTAPFGGIFDWSTRRILRKEVDAFRPRFVLSWMNRATSFCPTRPNRHRFIHIGSPRGYYNPKYYRRCDHLVVTTADIKSFYVSSGWADTDISVVPNFVSDQTGIAVSRASLATPEDAPVLLALGRLHENKGFDVLLDAMVDLPTHYLWIGGAGPLETPLKCRAQELNIDRRVRFLGWQDDTPSLHAAADVFVCSSRHEPFGNIVIEAWMHRTPIVATASEGPAHLIADGVNGLVVPLNDHAALSGAIDRLAREDGLANRLAEAGRRSYEAGYTEETCCARYMGLFDSLAG